LDYHDDTIGVRFHYLNANTSVNIRHYQIKKLVDIWPTKSRNKERFAVSSKGPRFAGLVVSENRPFATTNVALQL